MKIWKHRAAVAAEAAVQVDPPTEYYTSRYSGEEIDKGIDGALQLGGASTPQGAIAALGAGVRPNLLVNPFFKVNQRRKSTYAAGGWTVDGWYNGAGSDGSLTPNQNGALLEIQRTGIAFYQAVDPIEKNLTGKHVLFSILYTGTPRLVISRFDDAWHHYTSVNFPSSDTPAIATVGADIGDVTTNDEIRCAIYSASGSTSIQVYGTKFEVGMQQSLAYQDDSGAWQLLGQPDPLEEIKCKRYQIALPQGNTLNYSPIGYGYILGGNSARILIPTPVKMRTNPTLVFISGNISGLSILAGENTFIPTSVSTIFALEYGVSINFTIPSGATNGPCTLRCTSGYALLDANLS